MQSITSSYLLSTILTNSPWRDLIPTMSQLPSPSMYRVRYGFGVVFWGDAASCVSQSAFIGEGAGS